MEPWSTDLEELESSFVPRKKQKLFNTQSCITEKRRIETEEYHPPVDQITKHVDKPKFQVHTVCSGQGCLHEAVYIAGNQFQPLVSITDPARNYPFALDLFQQQAILCIDNGQSVLVSAHTSSGKTVVAEYAIARGLRHRQRVIYTTPIKALSNQKFREFTEAFKDVGLMTGDITINPEATVLIMTTEILRSMLYRGSDITREVGWVIFDEVHYLRDKERGVVWEETIILLPDSVGLVFLSATIPNARQFAQWIVSLHNHPCHVVYTDYRPVPLQHYVFPCGGDGIHLVVNQKREFLESNFNAALQVLQNAAGEAVSDVQMRGRKGGSIRPQTYCTKLVKLVMDQNLEPLLVFSFSKMDCEFYATQMNRMDFNTDTEKAAVDLIFQNAIASLSEADKQLPQVQLLLPVLRRGVGIHHGGLLPILKEIVEILFAEGLIKVLYATETFAMGLNMPARTVLFTATRKFDGRDFRLISSGEYIQMSGRAGRRGKDERGTVILMLDNRISSTEARQLLLGEPDRLDSSFYLTNNMVLNLLRVEDVNPEFLLERSFYQFQNQSRLPSLEKRVEELGAKLQACRLPSDIDLQQLGAYVQLRIALAAASRDRWAIVMKAKSVIPFLQPGRVVKVHTLDDIDFGWGIVLHINQSTSASGKKDKVSRTSIDDTLYTVECLLNVALPGLLNRPSDDKTLQQTLKKPIPLSLTEPAFPTVESFEGESSVSYGEGSVCLVTVPLSCLAELSSICMSVKTTIECASNKTDVLARKWASQPESVRRELWDGIERARIKLGGSIPLLDPIKDMNNKDHRLKEYTEVVHMLESRIQLNPLTKRPDIDQLIDLYTQRSMILRELNTIRKQMQNKESVFHMDELCARKRLLRRLGFCSDDDAIAFKGRIACELSSGDELMLTELMLDGLFSSLTPAQVAGVLSCFVAERSSGKTRVQITPDMEQALKTIQTKARFLARAAAECRIGYSRMSADGFDDKNTSTVPEAGALLNSHIGIFDDEQAYVDRFTGEMMEVVRAWAQGISFARLCELTSVFEGSVIRCMRRLDELLRQMYDAAKVAGNVELENKFSEAMVLIRRDIVFAASLYL